MDTTHKEVFYSSEMRELLSLAKTTTLTDAKAVRDHFTNVEWGKWKLREGVDLDALIKKCKESRIKRLARLGR